MQRTRKAPGHDKMGQSMSPEFIAILSIGATLAGTQLAAVLWLAGHIRSEMGGLRAEIGGLRTHLRNEMGSVRTEIRNLRISVREMGSVRTEIRNPRTHIRRDGRRAN